MTFDLENLVRPNIRRLKPYSSARSEFAGAATVFLDANENAFIAPAGEGFNRYPDPLQNDLKRKISRLSGANPTQIFIGNGSDEAIDLLFRIFCEPGNDECIVCPPTYGMYRVSADINDVSVIEVPLTSDYQLNVPAILSAITTQSKMIFICSPNNPTGNLMRREDIEIIAGNFRGLVVVDEAYIHFAEAKSMVNELGKLPNLVILQTFSKAWGMAGLRVGMAFASEAIVSLMNRVKPPYNVSGIAQRAAVAGVGSKNEIDRWVAVMRAERKKLIDSLAGFSFVETIYPTDANFVLVKVRDADGIYRHLINAGIVVRNRSRVELCEGCLRVTVGTPQENSLLLTELTKYRGSS
jgi:histidinol-phosphate aminotransferase